MITATHDMRSIDGPAPVLPDDLLARLYRRSGAERWLLSRERFDVAVRRSVAHRFVAASPDRAALDAFLDTLHLEDLALASACRDGQEAAWAHFAREVQPHVRAAGRAIAGPAGEELADGLMADLFGTTMREGERRSLLEYFHGRSKLTTWLRTVLAQRHVDRMRVIQREFPLDDEAVPDRESVAAHTIDRPLLLAVFDRQLERAVAGLEAGDRLRLAYYHVHGLTLARIGRLMGEHESSVSRKLERTRRLVRDRVERALREDHGFGDADLRQCYDEAGRLGTMTLSRLFRERAPQDPAASPFKPQDAP